MPVKVEPEKVVPVTMQEEHIPKRCLYLESPTIFVDADDVDSLEPKQKQEYDKVAVADLKRVLTADPGFLISSSSLLSLNGRGAHTGNISSFAIHVAEKVDLVAVLNWINKLLDKQSLNLYRMKGILAVEGCDERYVYHAVHMVFEGKFVEPWADDEERSCRLVIIGKDLDKAALESSFRECLATEECKARRAEKLRFRIGTVVECMMGGAWHPGKIVGFWYHAEELQAGLVDPYEILLDSGITTSVGADDNRIIRLPIDEDDSDEDDSDEDDSGEDDSDDDMPALGDPDDMPELVAVAIADDDGEISSDEDGGPETPDEGRRGA